MATSQDSGQLVQNITTLLACLCLALASCWSLTLVILAGIPFTIIVSIACEIITGPLLYADRLQTSKASGLVERVVVAISTIKAFNAVPKEKERFSAILKENSRTYLKCTFFWGLRLGISSTLMFAMFVQGFWYGSHLVQTGKYDAGTVMTVFWSSLLASSQIQLIIQSLNIVEKGKIGMVSLMRLIQSPQPQKPSRITSSQFEQDFKRISSSPSSPTSPDSINGDFIGTTPSSPTSRRTSLRTKKANHAVHMSIEEIPHSPPPSPSANQKFKPSSRSFSPTSPHSTKVKPKMSKPGVVTKMRKIRPTTKARGEFVLRGVSFSYPSRRDTPVLKNVDMYLPSGDTTYIVGGSGSGKSTIAQLLLGLYDPALGSIEMDDQDMRFLDPEWRRTHVAAVSQQPIVFDLDVHDNVALGLCGTGNFDSSSSNSNHVPNVSRETVIAACRTALLHDFIRDLPDGYSTQLGARGAFLSGGQKQRLAIARARVRDPTVLILDEAVSALDPTSRLLVHEAIKQWRRGKTTIVITHDLSQVDTDDFVYLMESGRVAEQGYRGDLELKPDGLFRAMATLQRLGSDESSEETPPLEESAPALARADKMEPPSPTGLDAHASRFLEQMKQGPSNLESSSTNQQRKSTRWVKGLSVNPLTAPPDQETPDFGQLAFNKFESGNSHRRNQSSLDDIKPSPGLKPLRLAERQYQKRAGEDAPWLSNSGSAANARRAGRNLEGRKKWSSVELDRDGSNQVAIQLQDEVTAAAEAAASDANPSLRYIVSMVWRSQPRKLLLIVGIFCALVSGGVTPVFSYILGKLLATMGQTGQSSNVLKYSLIVLLLAFVEGIFAFLRWFIMEIVADLWINSLRRRAHELLLRQDKSWFDRPENSVTSITTSIIKDSDDARNLVGRIIPQLVVVVAMIGVGLIWALVSGWQLTLVGLAFGPIFILTMSLQSRVVSKFETRNKRKREEVSKRFYDMVANVRGIRAMALEPVFSSNFHDATLDAENNGRRGAAVSGFGFGLGEALTYLAEALMYYVGAVLIIKGTYNFEKMLIVFNLIIFAVTFAAQTMAYLPDLSKAVRATADLDKLLSLSNFTSETPGSETSIINGSIEFKDVGFSYPTRSDVQVLSGMSFQIKAGETVCVVGGSGCGKSTVTNLLQRLYEPCSGRILIDGRPLDGISTLWLREHITIVSQNPNLFDKSISDNIAYGSNSKILPPSYSNSTSSSNSTPSKEEIASAARLANADDFISSLPKGYDTLLGDNASLISGGQAQRLAIARALIRSRAKILILDECTSALDPKNQAAVVETLMGDGVNPGALAKRAGLTTLVVTHKLDLMKRCDRVLVVEDGKIVQQGSYEELVKMKGGTFAKLASGGEWGA